MLTEFKNLSDFGKTFPDEESCIKYFEGIKWSEGVVSPFNPGGKFYKCKNGRYMCASTSKYFNVRTGTCFEGTKIPLLKWFMGIYLYESNKKGLSSYHLARLIGVTQKTSWLMLSKIREMSRAKSRIFLMGTVEADEAHIPTAKPIDKDPFTGKNKNREHLSIILGAVERGGKIVLRVTKNKKTPAVKDFIESHVFANHKLFTDEFGPYKALAGKYDHSTVNHSQKEYVRGEVHTNNIEAFWSVLKRGIYGIYHQVSAKHLQRYCDEFSFRYNTRLFSDVDRFRHTLKQNTTRLTYNQLVKNEVKNA